MSLLLLSFNMNPNSSLIFILGHLPYVTVIHVIDNTFDFQALQRILSLICVYFVTALGVKVLGDV